MQRSFLLFLLSHVIGALAMGAGRAPVSGVKERIPELDSSAQLILVITESWAPGPARLRTFERRSGEWAKTGEEIRACIGKKGLAWGIGLHGSYPLGADVKKEGDGKSPAGVFDLNEVFGARPREEAGIIHFPYRQVGETSAGVDDPNSRYYNRIVESTAVNKDWTSAEDMLRADGLYRLGAMVKHNWQPFPGYGSCIFLHTWQGVNVGTSGCTAMASKDLDRLLRWLDGEKRPLLVQLPAAEYELRKRAWKLP